jgi:hypothetical protein
MSEVQDKNFRQLDTPSSKRFEVFGDLLFMAFSALDFMQYLFDLEHSMKTSLRTETHTFKSAYIQRWTQNRMKSSKFVGRKVSENPEFSHCCNEFKYGNMLVEKPGWLSRYSDELRDERPKIFLFSTVSRPALGPTQPTIEWVQKAFPWG